MRSKKDSNYSFERYSNAAMTKGHRKKRWKQKVSLHVCPFFWAIWCDPKRFVGHNIISENIKHFFCFLPYSRRENTLQVRFGWKGIENRNNNIQDHGWVLYNVWELRETSLSHDFQLSIHCTFILRSILLQHLVLPIQVSQFLEDFRTPAIFLCTDFILFHGVYALGCISTLSLCDGSFFPPSSILKQCTTWHV